MNYVMEKMRTYVQHFDPPKYFKMRDKVVSGSGVKIINLYRLYRIKKMDAFNNASLGTFLGHGAVFKGIPNFPHGLYGIIVSQHAVIGNNCTIFHQVTIGDVDGKAPTLGDNVLVCPGAKLLGDIKIGNNVKIGANCVVVKDIPDNATVVCEKARIIEHSNEE
ncbi:MAG: transferase [Ruminococcus sp.]|nr:transferase [Ruminococcus sp.]